MVQRRRKTTTKRRTGGKQLNKRNKRGIKKRGGVYRMRVNKDTLSAWESRIPRYGYSAPASLSANQLAKGYQKWIDSDDGDAADRIITRRFTKQGVRRGKRTFSRAEYLAALEDSGWSPRVDYD